EGINPGPSPPGGPEGGAAARLATLTASPLARKPAGLLETGHALAAVFDPDLLGRLDRPPTRGDPGWPARSCGAHRASWSATRSARSASDSSVSRASPPPITELAS